MADSKAMGWIKRRFNEANLPCVLIFNNDDSPLYSSNGKVEVEVSSGNKLKISDKITGLPLTNSVGITFYDVMGNPYTITAYDSSSMTATLDKNVLTKFVSGEMIRLKYDTEVYITEDLVFTGGTSAPASSENKFFKLVIKSYNDRNSQKAESLYTLIENVINYKLVAKTPSNSFVCLGKALSNNIVTDDVVGNFHIEYFDNISKDIDVNVYVGRFLFRMYDTFPSFNLNNVV